MRILQRRDKTSTYQDLVPHIINTEMAKMGLIRYKPRLSDVTKADLRRVSSDLDDIRAAIREEFRHGR